MVIDDDLMMYEAPMIYPRLLSFFLSRPQAQPHLFFSFFLFFSFAGG